MLLADDNMIKEIGSEQKTSGTISTEKKVMAMDDSDLGKEEDLKIVFPNSER